MNLTKKKDDILVFSIVIIVAVVGIVAIFGIGKESGYFSLKKGSYQNEGNLAGGASKSFKTAAQAGTLIQTLTIKEAFGVNHPDQVIDFDLNQTINPYNSFMIGPYGNEVPYQLLFDGKIAVETDLASNTSKTWKLYSGQYPNTNSQSGVRLKSTNDSFEITNGITGVRVIRSGALPNELTLAPIQGILLRDGKTWTAIGPNYIFDSNNKILNAKQVNSTILENGSLKSIIRVSYTYDRPDLYYGPQLLIPGGLGYYNSTITLEAGQPSILIEDDTDMDLGYFLNFYPELGPDQARYRGSASTSKEFGYDENGNLYDNVDKTVGKDAFMDLQYNIPMYSSYVSQNEGSDLILARMQRWIDWTSNSGYYWMIYKKSSVGNVVGMFGGQASRLIGAHDSGAGLYTSPVGAKKLPSQLQNTINAGFNFQTNRRGPDTTLRSRVRIPWAIFVGNSSDIGQVYSVQNIGKQFNLHGGFNLNKIYRYQLDFADPPRGYGGIFMDASVLKGMINKLRSDPRSVYYNYLRNAEPYSRPLIDMWRDSTGAKTHDAANVVSVLATNMLNEFVNGEGIRSFHYHYWHGGLAMSDKSVWIDSILADPLATVADRANVKSAASIFGYFLWDDDFVPLGNWWDYAGTFGTANMPIQQVGYKNLYVLLLPTHPFLQPKINSASQNIIATAQRIINDYGSTIGASHYIGASMEPTLNNLLQLKQNGQDFFASELKLSKFAEFYMNLLTPPEVRFGNDRRLVAEGDSSTERTEMTGILATGFRNDNPDLSARLMGAWNQGGKRHSGFFASTLLEIDENAPASDPKLGNANFKGYMSVLRNGWGNENETGIWLYNGDFLSDHRHDDRGSIVIYALKAPLSVHWGSIYSPHTGSADLQSMVVPESNYPQWNQDNQPFNQVNSNWRNSSNGKFQSFTQSAIANAIMMSDSGLIWERNIYSIHADEDYPIILLKDNFSGIGNTQPKIILFDLMANGSVNTPAGTVNPSPRLTGYPNVTIALPSASQVFSLNPGVNKLSFNGQTWNAHPTKGIDWDLYTLSDETLSANIGNWGNSWSGDSGDFKKINGQNYFESQHILRIRANGAFQTLILPYRKGEKADLSVARSSNEIVITGASEITRIGDSYFAFSSPSKTILTSFSGNYASANNISIQGGPLEVVISGSVATVTAHGAKGFRQFSLPGNWTSPSPIIVSNGQFSFDYENNDPVSITLISTSGLGALPIASLAASPSSINYGESSKLIWSTIGATSVSIDNGIGIVPASGFLNITSNQTRNYTLTAINSAGSINRTATITVIGPIVNSTLPTASLNANPSFIATGQSSRLSWVTTGATTISIDKGIGIVNSTGSLNVTPNQNTTYTLIATNLAGSATSSATVTVALADQTPPIISNVVLSSPTPYQSTIVWNTNELSDSQVEYGFNNTYGSLDALNVTLTTIHKKTISGLQPNSTYHFRVKSRDAAGNLAVSGDYAFTTSANNGTIPDSDKDGILDNIDKCPDTKPQYKNSVNEFGCPLPKHSKFSSQSTNFSITDLKNVKNLTLVVDNAGKIRFNKDVSLLVNDSDPVDLDNFVDIQPNKIIINTTNVPQLNVSATITFFNIIVSNPISYRDGIVCSDCSIASYENTTLTFTVPHFTEYSIRNGTCGDAVCSPAESCSSCAQDCGSCPPNNGGSSGGGSSGGGGGGGGGNGNVCNKAWSCGDWSSCFNGFKTRECSFAAVPQHYQENPCDTISGQPATSQTCQVNRVQATCSDGIRNQNEIGIDCGGICNPCPQETEENNSVASVAQVSSGNQTQKVKPSNWPATGNIIVVSAIMLALVCVVILALLKSQSSTAKISDDDENVRKARLFVSKLRRSGKTDQEIKVLFLRRGWLPEDVAEILKK